MVFYFIIICVNILTKKEDSSQSDRILSFGGRETFSHKCVPR